MTPRLFWDSSGLISAVLSPNDFSAGRLLLQLGQDGSVDMRVSREVIMDCDRTIRRVDPDGLHDLAELIIDANIATTLDPHRDTIDRCIEMTSYLPDARVLAAAIECDADLFITHDAEHFLGNPLIGPPDTRLRVVTPQEALEWVREQFRTLESA